MKNTKRKSPDARFIRSYGNMRGMNLIPGKESTDSFSYLENMYVDYEGGGGAVESIPGFRRLCSFGDTVHRIMSVGDYVLIHAGNELYKIKKEERDNIPALCPIATVGDCECYCCVYEGSAYVICDGKILNVGRDGAAKEISLPSNIEGCSIGAVYGGRLYIAEGNTASCRVFCVEACDGEIESADFCLKIPEKVLSLTSAQGYLWAITACGAIGYKMTSGEFHEEIRLSEVRPTSEAIVFNNEPVFLTESGLYSASVNNGGELTAISTAINPMLLKENLSSAHLSVWRGYLVVSVGGRMYLADSRDKVKASLGSEYRWYYLNGIGTYRADRRVYRYGSIAPDGFHVHERVGDVCDGEIMSVVNENNEKLYYVLSADKKYSVYPTEQMQGGSFFPAVCVCETDGLLFFATECGDLCVFNNDMRGKAPTGDSNGSAAGEGEPDISSVGRIRPEYYSFDGHAPRYALLTPRDCCGLPFGKKKDLTFSLSLRLKHFPRGAVTVETRYDEGSFVATKRISNSSFSFYDIDFDAHSASSEELSTVNLSQGQVCWTEKQISVYSNEFCSPFGVYSIGFAYKIPKSQKHFKKGTK